MKTAGFAYFEHNAVYTVGTGSRHDADGVGWWAGLGHVKSLVFQPGRRQADALLGGQVLDKGDSVKVIQLARPAARELLEAGQMLGIDGG